MPYRNEVVEMSYSIIDAHAHLWKELKGEVEGHDVRSLGDGRSSFKGEVRQMMPPYMLNGSNTAEMFIANMNCDSVSGAVITQEFIDGNQNDYLLKVKEKYGDRFKICGMADFRKPGFLSEVQAMCKCGFDCIKVPAQWLVTIIYVVLKVSYYTAMMPAKQFYPHPLYLKYQWYWQIHC